MTPYPPGDGVRDEKLLDQTDTHVLWSMRSGSKTYWVICTYDGKIVDAAYTRKSKAYDAWKDFKMQANKLSAARVASRYLEAQGEPWLPDYLGAGAPVAEHAMKFIKENVADSKRRSPSFANDAASVAGGVFYLTLKAAGLTEDAQRMWPILDQNAGLHVGSDMGYVGERVYNALLRGNAGMSKEEKALVIAGLGVELLQRTRQPSKAKLVNRIFVQKYGDALAMRQPGREKAKTMDLVLQEHLTPEVVQRAKSVATKLGNDPAKALSLIEWLADDANFRELARVALGAGPSKDLEPQDVAVARDLAPDLDYAGETIIAFGVALLQAMGATRQLASFTRSALSMAKAEGLFSTRLAGDAYLGNPDGQSIYENSIDHGYREPLAGGTDVMRKLQNQLLHEQGREQRPESPRLATNK